MDTSTVLILVALLLAMDVAKWAVGKLFDRLWPKGDADENQ